LRTLKLRIAMMIWMTRQFLTGAVLALAVATAAGQPAQPSRLPAPGHEPGVIPPLSPALQSALQKTDTVTVPWLDNAELGPGQWKADGMWHWMFQPQRVRVLDPTIYPRLVVYPDTGYLPYAFSGNSAFWFGEDSNGTFIGNDFDRNQFALSGGESNRIISGSLVTPAISLVGIQSANLSFMTWWEIEGVDTDRFDLMNVEASSDGGTTWLPLGRGILNPLADVNAEDWKPYSSGGLGARGQWVQQIFNLNTFGNKVVTIRFRFDSGDTHFNGFRGWLIDDISVSPVVLPPPTIVSIAPSVVNPGHVVSLIGTNFVSGATVQYDTTGPASAAVVNANLTMFYAPSLPGTHNLQLVNPDGQSAIRLRAFTVSLNLAPTIISMSPDSAAWQTSVPFTIFGNHFHAGVGVEIGGIALPPTALVLTDSTAISGTTPFTLPPGVHTVRVVNTDGLADLFVLGFKVYVPQMLITALNDSVAGQSQGFTITPPAGTLFTSGTLFYRQGGMRTYDTLALSNVTGQFRGSIPAAATTLRGVEYWVRLSTLQGVSLTFPLTNPAGSPAIYPVKAAGVLSPLILRKSVYRMVSTPVDLNPPGVLGQFGDDYGIYNPARWRLFRWEQGAYREFPRFAAPLAPGYAFWLVTASGAGFDLKGVTSVNTSQDYYIALDTGWNQIANPFAFPVAWASVGVLGNVTGPYSFDGFQYRIDSLLIPFNGYFVRNNSTSPAQILVPPLDASLYSPKVTPAANLSLSGDYTLRLAAELPGTEYRDTYNYLGLRQGATTGQDALDAPKPPPPGDALELSILDNGVAYLQNFKPAGTDGESWIVALRGIGVQGKVLVTLTQEGAPPPGFELHVLDLANENVVPAGSGTFEAILPASGAAHLYKIIIGTPAFAERERKGIPLEPVAFALEQNYPNPFNPETTIRYALAKKTGVALEIYNTLGQRVRTLVSGLQSTGVYEVRWDGMNDAGRRTASGVYFYRLRTDEFTSVRSLVLIR
jgi:hypothetical protein